MSQIIVARTFGPLFGMDQMCSAKLPDDVKGGDHLLFTRGDGEVVSLEIGAIHLHGYEGELNELLGLGLRGQFAVEVSPGDVLELADG